MTLSTFKERRQAQLHYTNRALDNRCRPHRHFQTWARNIAHRAKNLQTWRNRHEAAQEKSSLCLPTTVSGAIEYYFGPYATEAHLVASCESGHSIYAVNGQYVGVFQMGYSERQSYGWYVVGDPPAVQVRSAHNYFVASGSDWSPWSCQP